MYIHQQPHKRRHKQWPLKNVASNNVEQKVRKEDEPEPFQYVELVCDLRMYFAVFVVDFVDFAKKVDLV